MRRYLITSRKAPYKCYSVTSLDITNYRGFADNEISIVDLKEWLYVTGISGDSFIWGPIEEIKEWS